MTLEDQYGVGDTVDLGPASGTVVAVGLRTTTVRAGDGTIWHVRNGEVLRVGNSSQGEAVVTIAAAAALWRRCRRAGDAGIAGGHSRSPGPRSSPSSMIEEPKLLGIVAMAPGIVTIGLTATVRAGDQDAFLRAVRGAMKIAFDRAAAADPADDYRPPAVPAAGDPG